MVVGQVLFKAEKEIKDALSKLNYIRIINELNKNQVNWMFNTLRSPKLGVAKDTFLKTNKRCLKPIALRPKLFIKHRNINAFLEVRSVVNWQPSVNDDI